ncbi:Proton-dependent oligopeptide transporter family [Cinnamomum micranthum f. kanehirae]|uniref:Proton-dependent oligopeptide transporter family n=1 Tax=Cinnamomum micranthum f. kanehirae TaxID=337451 RepID=A0A443P5X9_9MAGN|nr:Proton-dependent oligopeptide transporter family [Cinnamomum micranthum f. kanehirae]
MHGKALEFSERLSYFGIATNLILYLTEILHQDTKTAAKNVNYWAGVTTTVPLIGGFLADAYIGNYPMVLISSIIYLMSLGILTMSELVRVLQPCEMSTCQKPTKLHKGFFFSGLYMISIATGGFKPSLESFGADQFDDDHSQERKKKMSFFNLWSFTLSCGYMLGVTVIVYVQDEVSWGTADIVLTSVVAIAIVLFVLGRPFYRYREPKGSPLTPMLQVLVAAIAKRNLPCPSNPNELYEPKSQGNKRLLHHTPRLRFLDKAAILDSLEDEEIQSSENPNPWKLATMTQVEEMKLVLNMVPIWLTSLTFGVCMAQSSTFFVKQGKTMNRNLTRHFAVPSASISAIGALSMTTTIIMYDRILIPVLRRVTRDHERGISILQRIGIGMAFTTSSMAVSALVERKRLSVVGSATSMSAFWLGPQFMILGIGEGFTLVGLQEYFYDQVPDTMRSLGIAFFLSVIGISNFLSSLLIAIVDHLTEKGGSGGWFDKDLKKSRLDFFYWLLTALGVVNLFIYVVVARRYVYKNINRDGIGSFIRN